MSATCWAISDGAAGNERQTLALAQALGLQPRVLGVRFAQPWAALAPHLTLGARQALGVSNADAMNPPWPDVAIGCGRQAALFTRLLRTWSGGRCFTVQILDPRIDPALFDIVVAPRHDQLSGHNVIVTSGSLHPVDDDWLAAARLRFSAFSSLPSPRTAVLVGASNRAQELDHEYFDALRIHLTNAYARDGGSFLVTTSRRTPGVLVERLRRDFAHWPGVFWSGEGDGENPYAGFLAWADRIVVTPDSVNMLSEACATGLPVYTFSQKPLIGKLARFHEHLVGRGYLAQLDGGMHDEPRMALRETADVAARIRTALADRNAAPR